ncbi:MAG: hypothetical protein EHM93_12190 [Bacteroidales bacterium]|nr:MAG: hypothetical protein EHM93_12190 [Bacteroidales bacterium]
MEKIYRLCSFLLGIGIIHTALTPIIYKDLNLNAFWFAGTGFAFVFLGIINLIASRVPQKWILNICIVSNIFMLLYTSTIALLNEPQAYILVVILIAVTVLSLIVRFKQNIK